MLQVGATGIKIDRRHTSHKNYPIKKTSEPLTLNCAAFNPNSKLSDFVY
jgi:hypothetical protein